MKLRSKSYGMYTYGPKHISNINDLSHKNKSQKLNIQLLLVPMSSLLQISSQARKTRDTVSTFTKGYPVQKVNYLCLDMSKRNYIAICTSTYNVLPMCKVSSKSGLGGVALTRCGQTDGRTDKLILIQVCGGIKITIHCQIGIGMTRKRLLFAYFTWKNMM